MIGKFKREYEKFLKLQLKRSDKETPKPKKHERDLVKEVLKHCPKCGDYAEYIFVNAERFVCISCGAKICPQCNCEPPHLGISCA
jgi:hypothetical protein